MKRAIAVGLLVMVLVGLLGSTLAEARKRRKQICTRTGDAEVTCPYKPHIGQTLIVHWCDDMQNPCKFFFGVEDVQPGSQRYTADVWGTITRILRGCDDLGDIDHLLVVWTTHK